MFDFSIYIYYTVNRKELTMLPPFKGAIKVSGEGEGLIIIVPSLFVSPVAVRKAYSIARGAALGADGAFARPKARSPETFSRDTTLVAFVDSCKQREGRNFGWFDCRLEWHEAYPHWRFSNWNVMKTTYHRAKGRRVGELPMEWSFDYYSL